MPPVKKPIRQYRRHFLKQWRTFSDPNMTQERAASALDIDRTTLSRIESGKSPYSQGLLEAAAELYGCEPWDLLNVDPTKERDVVDLVAILKRASPEQKAEVIGFARGRVGEKH